MGTQIGSNEVSFGLVWTGSIDDARRAEALGVDALWCGGHIAFRSPTHEPLMRLAQLAAITERVAIGTSIAILPLYHPVIVAKQVADLDQVTAGRVLLGVGAGGDWPPEFEACQVPLGDRGRRMNEQIDVIRTLWQGGSEHPGPLFPFSGVRIDSPATVGGPPIVVAGRKLPAVRRAAMRGDGWMPYLYSPRRYAESVATIRETAHAAERSLDRFRWMVFGFVLLDRDGAAARRRAADILSRRYGRDVTEMVSRIAITGTPDEVAEQLVEFVDAGARHLILAPLDMEDRASVETLLTDVAPAVRAATTRN